MRKICGTSKPASYLCCSNKLLTRDLRCARSWIPNKSLGDDLNLFSRSKPTCCYQPYRQVGSALSSIYQHPLNWSRHQFHSSRLPPHDRIVSVTTTGICMVIRASASFKTALFAITAMSTGTVVIVITFLILNLLQDFRRINKCESSLQAVTAISFLGLWFSLTPRTNPKISLLGELHKSVYSFAPLYIRDKIGASQNRDDQIFFWLIPLMLLIIWMVQANFALTYLDFRHFCRGVAWWRFRVLMIVDPGKWLV